MAIFMHRSPSAGEQASDICTAGTLASPASIQNVTVVVHQVRTLLLMVKTLCTVAM
jgi:hypothetical protein